MSSITNDYIMNASLLSEVSVFTIIKTLFGLNDVIYRKLRSQNQDYETFSATLLSNKIRAARMNISRQLNGMTAKSVPGHHSF